MDEISEIFESRPFAEGSCRYAFLGKIAKGKRKGTDIVIKKWKSKHIYRYEFYDKDILCYKEALSLINKWNDLNIINKKYVLSNMWLSKCISTKSNSKFKKDRVQIKEWVFVEKYLNGNFIKFNSNSGYINNKYINSSIQAFSHYTYHISSGKYLFCDLQGIRTSNNYILTDPCICSIDKKFGITDIGEKGIYAFFNNHRCNKFCNKNWIKPNCNNHKHKMLKKSLMTKNTRYQFQIV